MRKTHPLRWKKHLGSKGSCVGTNFGGYTLPFFGSCLPIVPVFATTFPSFLRLTISSLLYYKHPDAHFPSEFPSSGNDTASPSSVAPPTSYSCPALLRAPPTSESTMGPWAVEGAGDADSPNTVSVMKNCLGVGGGGILGRGGHS